MIDDEHAIDPDAGASDSAASKQILPSPDERSAKVTVGMSLQAMREYQKLSLEDVAAETQISKEKIDNIEKMNFEQPSVFLRGAVKTYAQMLGLPADAYAKEYIEAIEGKIASDAPKTIIDEAPAINVASLDRFAKPKKKTTVSVTVPMIGGGLAAGMAVGVIVWGLTGTEPPAPAVSKSVLAITTPQSGGDQSLMAEVGAAEAATAETVDLHIAALKTAWIEVRGADGTIFRSRRMAAGETYYPRLGSGWTVTARDGSAFEWRVEDVSIGKLSEEPVEVFAVSVDQAARQAAEILAPPMVAGTNESQSVR